MTRTGPIRTLRVLKAAGDTPANISEPCLGPPPQLGVNTVGASVPAVATELHQAGEGRKWGPPDSFSFLLPKPFFLTNFFLYKGWNYLIRGEWAAARCTTAGQNKAYRPASSCQVRHPTAHLNIRLLGNSADVYTGAAHLLLPREFPPAVQVMRKQSVWFHNP